LPGRQQQKTRAMTLWEQQQQWQERQLRQGRLDYLHYDTTTHTGDVVVNPEGNSYEGYPSSDEDGDATNSYDNYYDGGDGDNTNSYDNYYDDGNDLFVDEKGETEIETI